MAVFPIPSKVASLHLGMSASTVPVECLVSTTGLICNSKRSSIGPEKLNRVVFLHENFDYKKELMMRLKHDPSIHKIQDSVTVIIVLVLVVI